MTRYRFIASSKRDCHKEKMIINLETKNKESCRLSLLYVVLFWEWGNPADCLDECVCLCGHGLSNRVILNSYYVQTQLK